MSETTDCPECGSFVEIREDPALPDYMRNVECPNLECHVSKLGERDMRDDVDDEGA